MPDENTPQAQAAAETNTGGDTPQTTATPSATPNAGKEAQAREVLRKANLPEQPTAKDPLFTSDVPDDPLFSDNQLPDPLTDGLEDTEPPEGETSPAAADTETQVTEEAETEGETNPESEEETGATEEEESEEKGPKRIRLRLDKMNSRDAAVVRLAHEKGISLDDARVELFGDATPAREQQTREPGETEPVAPSLSEIERTIQTLKADRRKAAEAMDTVKMAEIDDQLDTAKDQLFEAKTQARTAQERDATRFERLKTESIQRVSEMYPDAVKEGSPLWNAIAEYISEKPKSFFEDPEWRESAAATVTARMGIAPVKAKTTEAAPAKDKPKAAAPAVAKRKATPVPAPAPGGSPALPAQTNVQQIQQRLATARANKDPIAAGKILRELQSAA